jgi:hypothetical protein
MSEICNIPHPLKREGTTQHERFPEALAPDYVRVDEQNIPQLVQLSHVYAKYIYFFPSDGSATINWQPFFEEIKQLAAAPENYRDNRFDFTKLESISQTKPHIALFLTFLRLFGFAQNSMNELGGRHLDFYYKEILQLKERPAVADKVALFFELEKNVSNKKLETGTLFKAGKDDTGKELYYKLTDEMLVNTAAVSRVKTVFVNKNGIGGKTASIHVSPDHLLPAEPWVTFGTTGNPRADIGFIIASPAFHLPEGTRTISIVVRDLPVLPAGSLTAEYTAAKEWATATSVTASAGNITITLNDQSEAMVGYDASVHEGNYNASDPILKLTLNKNAIANANNLFTDDAHDYFKNIKLNNSDFSVTISVTGVRKLFVESDTGTVETAKPFFPFGATPVTGSGFYVGYPLAFNKYLRTFRLHYNLLQPEPAEVITAYAKNNELTFSVREMVQGVPDFHKISFKAQKANAELQANLIRTIDVVSDYMAGYSFADVFSLNNKTWNTLNTKAYRSGLEVTQNGGQFTSNVQPEISALTPGTDGGFIKLTLTDESLDYEKYIKRFTAAITSTASPKPVPPEKPAAPKMTDLSLDYTLQLGLADIEYFHVHPFGFEEITNGNSGSNLLPVYNEEGNLLIGISHVQLPGLLSIYFQLQEDSGDVNKTIQPTSWYCLKGNRWNKLELQQILRDSTQSLTQSGIISFNLVETTADTNHTILENGLVWLKVSIPFDSAAYPKMISIRSQAALAIFDNRENDPAHLRHPLKPESITKFLEKPDGIKSVIQPFESFGGKMKEENRSFYTRVSERLRHKQRAWTIWDYERIILENFPFVYKVKCIPHTTEQTEYAPGHATIIVIPNLVNTATYNTLEPRVSAGNLQKISEFINRYHSPFAKVKVINPVYEKIRVEADLVLHPRYNDQFYAGELKRRITEYLAPWINNDPVKLSFNGFIHRSSLINLLDESEYVDYVTDFKMIKLNSSDLDTASGVLSDEFAPGLECNILTSAGMHIININKPC